MDLRGIFDFMMDMSDHSKRQVTTFIDDERGLRVDTCIVSDGEKPFETAVKHPRYDGGKWIIVEAYDTIGQAELGHKRWVTIMTGDPLPESLTDCANSNVSRVLKEVGGPDELVFTRAPIQ
jgi:hypothetical protein